ncbi:MAG: hypothetical protein ACQEP6_02750, partial [Patescibacteria group bacterium]
MSSFSKRGIFKVLILLSVFLLVFCFVVYRAGLYPEKERGATEVPNITEENTIHFSKAPERVGDELWVFGELDHVFLSNNGNYFLN